MGIKILLADDHEVVRRGLRSILEQYAGMEIVAEAENGRAAVELARQHSPDVAVLDITMPELNGTEATRQIVSHSPGTKVIALSLHSEQKVIDDVLAAGDGATGEGDGRRESRTLRVGWCVRRWAGSCHGSAGARNG